VKGTIESIFQLGLAFFGLTSDIVPQARAALFKQIHEIVFFGNGGYDWQTIYDMPIWLRKFTFNEIKEFKSKPEPTPPNMPNQPQKKTLVTPSGKVNTPEFLKASEQYKRPAKWK